jgi:thioredoxin reductase
MKNNHNPISLECDYLIIGAGPAGLQLGYYMEQAGWNYLILEAGPAPGSFFKTFPRHRRLISINKIFTGYEDREINLRWDWNSLLSDSEEMLFKHYSSRYFPAADDLVRYLGDFANHFKLRIKYGAKVVRITKDNRFRVSDGEGNVYVCQRLIVATGFTKPYIPPIPGIELAERYVDVCVDPADFKNQRVLIVGKGNSGFETAENLLETAAVIHVASPKSITNAWKSHYVGHLRAVNNNFLDTYQLKSQNAVLDGTTKKITRENDRFVVSVSYSHASGEEEDLIYDRVIVCTGFRFDDSIFDETCKPALTNNDRFPAQTSEWESSNVKDLYFAGTLMQVRDFHKTTSGFIHGFRYNIRVLKHILDFKYHNTDLPSQCFSLSPEAIVDKIIGRVNTSSALWQQFGFLCDLIVISREDHCVRYYEELPVDYVHDTALGQHDQYYLATLEYGRDVSDKAVDPFRVNRIEKHDVARAELSSGLHPIIRRFAGSKLISQHHVIEDLASEWSEDVHVKPLLSFFNNEISMIASA